MTNVSTVETEAWRPVAGYEATYEVSDHGRVRSVPRRTVDARGVRTYRGRLLSPQVFQKTGHLIVRLSVSGKSKTHYVHRLVLEAFVGPAPGGLECCHNDGIPTKNRLSNLRWDTRLANREDAVRHGVKFGPRKTSA